MARESRYDPLFEPLKIGPVTAPNRFYLAPHCSGMDYHRPQMMAPMHGVKAGGGWHSGELQLQCIYGGRESKIGTDYLVPISARIPGDEFCSELAARRDEFDAKSGLSLQRIGNCRAPGIIPAASYAGHKAARELGQGEARFKHERVVV